MTDNTVSNAANNAGDDLVRDDETFRLIERVHQYRAHHGIPWGGPPYSEAELAYAHGTEEINS